MVHLVIPAFRKFFQLLLWASLMFVRLNISISPSEAPLVSHQTQLPRSEWSDEQEPCSVLKQKMKSLSRPVTSCSTVSILRLINICLRKWNMKADSSRMAAAIGARQYLHKARGGNSYHGGAGVAVILMFAVMSSCICMPLGWSCKLCCAKTSQRAQEK